ncbi:MAG: hypothetical protein A2Y12_10535 [Planctomycetes bacterium GWF2_42_9]|nr:MAG: hypothetical protein A2Y12_10535 [Planctomycetes bacterium GWF2_42_9]
MNVSLRLFVMVLAMLAAAANADIAVNFPAGVNISGVVGAPGYEQDNWLNTANQADSWGITYDLKDETNTSTGAVMDFWASAFGLQGGFSDDPMAARMLERGIGTCWSDYDPDPAHQDPATFRVINIPYQLYDVVVYFGSRELTDYVQKVNVNGSSLYARVPANTGYTQMGYRKIPNTSTSNLEANTPYGNYMVFKGLTSSTLVVRADWAGGSGTLPRAYISGFQIIENECIGAVHPIGDLNGDCKIDFSDIAVIAAGWLIEGAAK